LHITIGSLNQPSGVTIERHIFVDEIADFQEIADGLPKLANFDPENP